MSTLTKIVNSVLTNNQNIFLPFIMAGYPSLSSTLEYLELMEQEGVELLELGVPFSDPVADGPTIQIAHEEALSQETSLTKVLEIVSQFNEKPRKLKVILFTYLNPILSFGLDRFAIIAGEAGVKGILVVDLLPEYCQSFQKLLNENDLEMIFLASPNTSKERLQFIAERTDAFIYYTSRKGVTGVQSSLPEELIQNLKKLKKTIDKPIMVGFGIKEKEEIHLLNQHTLGAVVGSALVKLQKEPVKFKALLRNLIAN